MTIANNRTFAVLFSVDFENKREAERLVLMRRFVEGGLGPCVSVLHEAVFPDYARCGFLVIAEAASQSVVEEAVSASCGVFHAAVFPVTIDQSDPEVSDAIYGLFAIDTPHNGLLPVSHTVAGWDRVKVRLRLTLPAGAWCTAIWLVSAPSYGAASSFPAHAGATGVIETAIATPMQDYFETKMGRRPCHEGPAESQADTGLNLLAEPWTIYNEGPLAACVDSDVPMPFTRNMAIKSIANKPAQPVQSFTYLWKSLRQTFKFHIHYTNANTFFGEADVDFGGDGIWWSYPDMVLPRTIGAPVGFDLETFRSHARTDLYLWLNELMTPVIFSPFWPEDLYSGGLKSAYEYILSKIPGNVPPKNGTLKEPSTISVIQYPNHANFTHQEFKFVQDHLLQEIDHFITVDRWFGPNGIINAITDKIGIVSSNDLTEAVQLMTIPEQSSLMFILDNVFNILARVLGLLIPGVGNTYASVVSISWNVAKLLANPGSNQPVNVPIANMADTLNQYLQAFTDTAEQQRKLLYGDWGKLSEFSKGVIEGKISPNQFYGGDDPPNLFDDEGAVQLPGEFLLAAANAWLLIIYQHLFASIHTVKNQISFSQNIPNNPWDPSQGRYEFVWSVPCQYKDSKGNTIDGYMVFDGSTDAPTPVLQQLFGSGSRFNVNPIEFFAGLNGWPRPRPIWDAGYQSTNMAVPTLPLVSLGLPDWGSYPKA